MKTVAFKSGETIAFIENGEIKKGVLRTIICETAIVDLDDEVKKVRVESIAKVQEDTAKEPEEIQEDKPLTMRDKITITSDEFTKIGARVISDSLIKAGENAGLLGFAFTLFMAELHHTLFDIDETEND